MIKLLCAVIIFLSSVSAFAEKPGEVLLRYGIQDNAFRIVLESSDELIKNANTTTSLTAVKIDFSAAFNLKKQNDFIFETSQKDRSLVINLKDIIDVRSYKLTTPSRIVIDLKTASKPSKELWQKTEGKPQQDTGQLPAQKGQKEVVPQDIQKAVQVPAQRTQQQAVPPAEKTHKIKVCVIDPGHGGYDHGIISQDVKEKEVSLGIAKDLNAVLAKKGVAVYLTRKADQAVPLTERINFLTGKKPELFIALHATASDKFAVYTSTADDANAEASVRIHSTLAKQIRHLEKSRSLSKAIGSSLRNEFKTAVVLRELPLPVLNSADAPSVLIEYPLTHTYIYDQKMRDRIVKALVNGITAYEQ
jgi:N-acetylmuramoyl-L-alanine amidase